MQPRTTNNLVQNFWCNHRLFIRFRRLKNKANYTFALFFFFRLNFNFVNSSLLSLSFPTLHSIPIAPIKTDKLVPPAEINGIGIPVGGIDLLTRFIVLKLNTKKVEISQLLRVVLITLTNFININPV